jgi:hypothetical protein
MLLRNKRLYIESDCRRVYGTQNKMKNERSDNITYQNCIKNVYEEVY